jgi:HlyD family secretion protein
LPNAALRFRPPASVAGSASAGDHGGRAGHRGGGGSGGTPGAASAAGASSAHPPEARTVWILRGSTPQEVAIHTGLSDGTVTEAVDGLADGDAVVVDVEGGEGGSSPASSVARAPRMF